MTLQLSANRLDDLIYPDPDDWEDYLILDQIENASFVSQPARFQTVYADVVQRLHSAGLIEAESVLSLTGAGQDWKQEFEQRFLC